MRNHILLIAIFLVGLSISLSMVLSKGKPTLLEKTTEDRIHLIELYTSEGCSSCPPADSWMSSLGKSKSLGSMYVPVVFHVDYWDYLGWKDEWGSSSFTDRQRRVAAQAGVSVYTPGMFRNGYEYTDWRLGPPESSVAETVGELSLYDYQTELLADFKNKTESGGKLTAHLALLHSGLSSSVKRGENKGRLLKHDFAVKAWFTQPLDHKGQATFKMAPIKNIQINSMQISSTQTQESRKGSFSIALWIEQNGRPIQALLTDFP